MEPKNDVGYRFLPHTADVRVAIEAETFAAVVMDAVLALRSLLVGTSGVGATVTRPVAIAGEDAAETLLMLLREVLFAFETEGLAPRALRVTTADPTLVAGHLEGEAFDPTKHETQPEVKAVTRHGLTVREERGRWHAELVFDL